MFSLPVDYMFAQKHEIGLFTAHFHTDMASQPTVMDNATTFENNVLAFGVDPSDGFAADELVTPDTALTIKRGLNTKAVWIGKADKDDVRKLPRHNSTIVLLTNEPTGTEGEIRGMVANTTLYTGKQAHSMYWNTYRVDGPELKPHASQIKKWMVEHPAVSGYADWINPLFEIDGQHPLKEWQYPAGVELHAVDGPPPAEGYTYCPLLLIPAAKRDETAAEAPRKTRKKKPTTANVMAKALLGKPAHYWIDRAVCVKYTSPNNTIDELSGTCVKIGRGRIHCKGYNSDGKHIEWVWCPNGKSGSRYSMEALL